MSVHSKLAKFYGNYALNLSLLREEPIQNVKYRSQVRKLATKSILLHVITIKVSYSRIWHYFFGFYTQNMKIKEKALWYSKLWAYSKKNRSRMSSLGLKFKKWLPNNFPLHINNIKSEGTTTWFPKLAKFYGNENKTFQGK